MHVPLAPVRGRQDFARGGMLHQKIFQPLTERTALRPSHPVLVEHHADAHVAALERNAPRPPAVAGKMVRRRRPNSMAGHRPIRKCFGQFESIPIFYARPARPHGRRGMRPVGPPPTFLSREQGGDPRRIHHPARLDPFVLLRPADFDGLQFTGSQLNPAHACGAPQLSTERAGASQDFFIEHRPVHLIRRHTRQVAPANFAALVERLRFLVKKPKAHPLFDEMRLIQVLGQAQHAAQKVAAHFHGRFTHAPRKRRRFLDDEHPQLGLLAQQHHRRRSASQCAPDDDDIKTAPVVGWFVHGT